MASFLLEYGKEHVAIVEATVALVEVVGVVIVISSKASKLL